MVHRQETPNASDNITYAADIKKALQKYVERSPYREELKKWLNISDNAIYSNMLPRGIPYIEWKGTTYTAVLDYDDMRGPQGIYRNLTEEQALERLIEAMEYLLKYPTALDYYHPKK